MPDEAALRSGCTLHHVAIVVPSIAAALPFYRDTLGLEAREIREVPEQAVRIAFLGAGESLVELVEPLDEVSGVARYLGERKKPSLHHVCIAVDDLPGTLRGLEDAGVELIDREPRQGAEGDVAFIHPRASGGVLVELIDRSTLHE
ncbi:MAG: methylmalonyl-CoA epimerase [Chloroflexota bacterium]|nr:methylmalonyl-CoA epimerase [Chloroflexota bacterium]